MGPAEGWVLIAENCLSKGFMREEKSFYPEYVFEILLVVFLTIELVLVIAMLYPQVIGRQIDFQAEFQPRPEWYFLWLYQLVRYFPGRTASVGTVLVPLAAIILLMLIPFIDKGAHGRVKATVILSALVTAFLIFTLIPALGR